MKRIVLTSIVEGYANDFLRDLEDLAYKPLVRLRDLKDQLSHEPQEFPGYVETIIHHYNEIITAKPDEIDTIIAGYFASFCGHINLSSLITIDESQDDGTVKQVTKKFYQHVTDALGYDEVQEQLFPKYIKKMGIKSCVYCNAQYTISAKKGKTGTSKKYNSTFTIDHYKPKSEYPYLATSFFNLYPACATCNQTKSYRDPIFRLYVKPTDPIKERNPFVFHLDKSSFVKYSMTGNSDDLEVNIKSRQGILPQEAEKFNEYFHIDKLYANLNDSVEEVIWRYRVYNKAGRQALFGSYGNLIPHKSDWNRFILGNYDREEDILKRPLAKLIQDVAKQLGII